MAVLASPTTPICLNLGTSATRGLAPFASAEIMRPGPFAKMRAAVFAALQTLAADEVTA